MSDASKMVESSKPEITNDQLTIIVGLATVLEDEGVNIMETLGEVRAQRVIELLDERFGGRSPEDGIADVIRLLLEKLDEVLPTEGDDAA